MSEAISAQTIIDCLENQERTMAEYTSALRLCYAYLKIASKGEVISKENHVFGVVESLGVL